jgi:hypothetical protein
MNRTDKLRGHIETLRDSLALDWKDLALPLAAAQRVDIEIHVEWCLAEMSWCLTEMKNHLGAAETQIRIRMPSPSRRSNVVVVDVDKLVQKSRAVELKWWYPDTRRRYARSF